MKTMKAVVYHGPGDVRVEQVPLPTCGDEELLIRVEACGVSGTELHAYRSPSPRITPPMTLGHEFVGVVEQAGEAVREFTPGQRLVMATTIACGQCVYCRKGWSNHCLERAPMGIAYPGAMAEFVRIPARALAGGHLVRVPSGLLPEHAALTEPVSCAVNAIEKCDIGLGDTVLVLGAGPMGLMNVCVARCAGASRIILSEVSPKRLVLAAQFDCDRLINPAIEDLLRSVKEATGGLGADVAVVAAPDPKAQELALDLVRKRGTVCLFASLPLNKSVLAVDSRTIHDNELRIVGSSDSSPMHVSRAVDLLTTGKILAERLVTHAFRLDQVFDAFDVMERGEALRVILKP